MDEVGVIRQGDIVLVPCEIPKTAKVQNRARLFGKGNGIIIAEGEATGHHHRVSDPNVRIRTEKGVRFLSVGKGGASLKHEEHDDIKLPAGSKFRIGRQREYTPPQPERKVAAASRRVAD